MIFIQIFITGLLVGGIYGLISIGLTLTYGVLKLVNFAHGDFLMIAMYITWLVCTSLGFTPYASVIIVVPLIFAFGLIIEKFIMEPVLDSSHVVQILTTFGLSIILQNGILMMYKADYRSVVTSVGSSVIQVGGIYLSTPHLIAFIVAFICAFGLYFYLQKTDMGMCMRAVSQNDKAAKLMGINVGKIYFITYGVGAAFVGIAAVMLMPIYQIYPTIGNGFAMIAFVSVVLGGLGSLPGAMFGGLIVGLVEALVGYYVGVQFQQAGYFLVFILILILKPSGLLGKLGGSH